MHTSRLTTGTVRRFALTMLLASGCAVDVDDDLEDAVAVDAADNAASSAIAAPATSRQAVRVLGRGAAVAGARVASRDARGRPIDVGFTDATGTVHIRTVADGYVVAAAPGFAGGSRIGGGEIRLAPLDAPERSVARLRDGRIVSEVVRSSDNTTPAPRAPGLGRAPAGAALPAGRFKDVAGHPSAAHIEALATRGIVAGDPDGRFRPTDTLSRAELVTLVLRATDIALDPRAGASFVDVESTDWFAAPVATARVIDIVRGDPDGRFRPRDVVTRAELAAVLVRAGALPSAAQPLFADVSDRHWAKNALSSAVSFCGLLETEGNDHIRPDAPATRAEAAVAISRLLSCGADRTIGRGTILARRAAQGSWSTLRKHHELLALTGFGTHYGDASAFHRLSLTEKRAYVDSHARPGTEPLDPTEMTRSSCIEYAMELAGGGYRALGDKATWDAIDSEAREEGLAGTKLAADLVASGWRAIYVNGNTAWRGRTTTDNEHSYSLAVARSEQTYYDVPLSGAFLDWETSEKKQAAMGAFSFGVLVLRGGQHVAAIADGAVHELSRGEGPDSHVLYDDAWSAIIDVYANEVHGGGEAGQEKARAMWNSGVLLVPPGVELDGVEGL